jgi:peptidoglycan/xylan/chitin deacetylase (PgdA/CDA1 family)
MEKQKSYLVISLDFELFWGMFDKVTIPEYGERIQGEQTAIPRMLELFSEYGIHATWATVGMLMTRSKNELLALLPPQTRQPRYQNMDISSYRYIESMPIGTSEKDDTYHFGSTLVQKILETPHQEIGNHTFSHFYCIDGHKNSDEVFEADIDAWNHIAKTYGIKAGSIVFPRNQASPEALTVCYKKGIYAYRGNEDHFLYRARGDEEQSLFIRAFRLLDHYINISGHHTYVVEKKEGEIVNIPASRFLRPWSKTLRFLEPLRMRRIKNAMTYAAKRGEVFHLWWHPHNFGIDQEENFKNLTEILDHFKTLEKKYGMQSASMSDLTQK